MINIKFYVILC